MGASSPSHWLPLMLPSPEFSPAPFFSPSIPSSRPLAAAFLLISSSPPPLPRSSPSPDFVCLPPSNTHLPRVYSLTLTITNPHISTSLSLPPCLLLLAHAAACFSSGFLQPAESRRRCQFIPIRPVQSHHHCAIQRPHGFFCQSTTSPAKGCPSGHRRGSPGPPPTLQMPPL